MEKRTAADRFWQKVAKTETCWLWTGSDNGKGYGQFWDGSRKVRVHRYAYEQLVGEIPVGLQVDHLCHNRRCVNPEHLRLATNAQNMENLSVVTAKSGYRGVHRKGSKWLAVVKRDGRSHYGGLFTRKVLAAQAAHKLRMQLFTHSDGR